MRKIWKEIPGFNGKNYASNTGEIVSVNVIRDRKGKIERVESLELSQYKKENGYRTVKIEGKNYYVHRLVASTFIENPNNYPQVNHKDENKENNSARNLEWCTSKYNVNYGTGIKRSKKSRLKDKYKVMNLDTGEVYDTPMDASIKTGIHNDSISKACKGVHKTAGGYRWRYLKNG